MFTPPFPPPAPPTDWPPKYVPERSISAPAINSNESLDNKATGLGPVARTVIPGPIEIVSNGNTATLSITKPDQSTLPGPDSVGVNEVLMKYVPGDSNGDGPSDGSVAGSSGCP